MSRPPEAPDAPVENKRQLVDYLASGCAPRADWRIGTEHEKFMFDAATLRPWPMRAARASPACWRA